MKRRLILGITMAMTALVVLSGSVMAATVFDNGSFETGPVATTTVPSGSGAVSGWTVTGSDIDYVVDTAVLEDWQAADATRSIDLNGLHTGGIAQTFETKVGSMYVVEFSLSGNPGTVEDYSNGFFSPSNKTLTVQATGGTAAPYSYDTAATHNTFADMKWQIPTAYAFKATGTEATLSFTSTTEGSFGPAIDNVRITETLVTGADCKKGGWQSMVDRYGTAFRNQGDCVSYWATGEKNLAF